MQAVIDAQHGGFQLQPWDWEFYTEQVRKAKYDLDESQVKPYFELNHVLENGVFYAANQLYGLTFKERKDLPVYQPDVRVFEVFDADGKPLALLYCDYFKRDNKQGGAWMDVFQDQSRLLGHHAVVYNVANFPKPAPGQPALISPDDVTTMFHEFGHALHGMFEHRGLPHAGRNQRPPRFRRVPLAVQRALGARPAGARALRAQLQDRRAHARGAGGQDPESPGIQPGLRAHRAAGCLHARHAVAHAAGLGALQNVDQFEKTALVESHVALRDVPPRYRSTYFLHIWANGYAAGYYAYLWTEMLDDDAFQWFQQHGGLTRANGERFRQMVLSRGNTEDLAKMYAAWRGRAPEIGAMLQDRGLTAH